MKILVNKIVKKIVSIIAIAAMTSCGETEQTAFSSGPKKEQVDPKQAAAEALAAEKAESATLGGTGEPIIEVLRTLKEEETGKTDILFVLDNSGSMANEVTLVSENLLAFFNKLKANTNTRIGIISATSTSVGSTSLFIPKEIRPEVILHEQRVSSVDAPDRVMEYLRGAGKFFYRKESSKVIVVVTDDNARNSGAYIGAEGPKKFQDDLFAIINKEDFKLYGFAANEETMKNNGKDGCSVSRKGEMYLGVAKDTAGEIFDICEKDWSPHFDKIADSLIASVKSKYNVSKVIKEIKSITLDGEEVPEGKYRFVSKTITIDEDLITKNDMEIKVNYIPN